MPHIKQGVETMRPLLTAVMKSWRSTLAGVVGFLMGAPVFVSAITAWGKHQPVDWRMTLVSVGLLAAGTIGFVTKDASVHSTPEEIQQAAAKEEGATLPPTHFDMSAARPPKGGR